MYVLSKNILKILLDIKYQKHANIYDYSKYVRGNGAALYVPNKLMSMQPIITVY